MNQEFSNPRWNLALDRIVYLKETPHKYIPTDIDWEEHFYDIIGVTKTDGAELQEIELIFSAEQANYIYTKPMHPSQRAKYLENGELKVKLKLIPNYELEMTLLSFGEKVRVINPETLRNRIHERLSAAAKQY
ncbi:helix-turn-helix transcriptional regulator [Mariniphaga sediminis]|uniref:helix-turn-helix transcriptional regulator n=1 Tax=Mariniphaga sediminis TaxID=1628158 RepID=UPI00403585E8